MASSPDSESCFTPADSLAAFEDYRGLLYLREGEQLTFLQTRRPAPHLRLQIGPHRITERTRLAELQKMFPRSYRDLGRSEDGRRTLFLYPPAHAAAYAWTWYAIVVEHDRVVQFCNVVNCEYD